MIISNRELESVLTARCSSPHDFLGLHPCHEEGKRGLVARAFVRDAARCEVIRTTPSGEKCFPMERLAPEGFFEGFIPRFKNPFPYQFRVTGYHGEIRQFHDPYSFPPTMGASDLHLFSRAMTTGSTKSSGATCGNWMGLAEPVLRCGLPTPRGYPWWATSIIGTAAFTP